MDLKFGAWSERKVPLLGDPAWDVFKSVFSKLIGCEYELTAYYTQVVSGTNYCFEMNVTPIVPNAQKAQKWSLVYKPNDGEAVLKGFFDTLPIK
ncbi:hypothetical protein [Acinetobacter sp. ANC 3832]|uniref:hypothetical protein n=1 Tax=Acinetobacter sp. ANC 3832 TaxID=1977874 RepID=UPI000A332BE3|nr:hypothetical protein [Acinetobacter sp. ANC 3832]OTG94843.1 hypothetical protein B9T35_05580 [Acinetobacter sp. ANC 3832]